MINAIRNIFSQSKDKDEVDNQKSKNSDSYASWKPEEDIKASMKKNNDSHDNLTLNPTNNAEANDQNSNYENNNGLSPPDIEPTSLEARVIEAIRLVYDPEIPVNIYELGLIYDINISNENIINIKMTLTAPGCPVAGDMPHWVSAAIESNISEVNEVNVEIVWDPPWSSDMMSEAARLELGYL